MNYDVVIVGAGPAGSAAARSIVRAGFKVLIVEKRSSVGKPVMCSGLVSPRTLDAAQIGRSVVINEIHGATVYSASGQSLELGGDKTHALAIDRAAFDAQLAQRAREDGADLLLSSRLTGIEREGRSLCLQIERGDGTSEVTTRLLIGADGAGSIVARWMGVRDSNGAVRAISAEGRIHDGVTNSARVFVGSSHAPGWFGWIIPLGDGRVRIGTGDGLHDGRPLRQLLDKMFEDFPEHFRGVEIDRVWAKTIPLYSPIKTCNDNILLVGDAARHVKPTSGGGIYTALQGARHCASAAIAALEKDNFSAGFLACYEEAWRSEFGAEFERGVDLRRAFLSLRSGEVDRLLEIFSNPFLRRLTNRVGDIDAPSILMEQLVKTAPLLRLFLHVPLRFPGRWAADLLAAMAGSAAAK